LEVAKLKSNPSFPSEEARVRAFVIAGLGCRATYFNYARKLQPHEAKSEIKLIHASPPPEVKSNAAILDILRRRYGLGNGLSFRLPDGVIFIDSSTQCWRCLRSRQRVGVAADVYGLGTISNRSF
jgi:hypothetical protein